VVSPESFNPANDGNKFNQDSFKLAFCVGQPIIACVHFFTALTFIINSLSLSLVRKLTRLGFTTSLRSFMSLHSLLGCGLPEAPHPFLLGLTSSVFRFALKVGPPEKPLL